MSENMNPLITIEEVCKMLNLGRGSAYRLLQDKEIKGFKIGKKWKIPKEAVNEYIEKKKEQWSTIWYEIQ